MTWIHLWFTSNCRLIRKLGHQYGRRGGINSGEVSHFLSLGCVKKENITQRRRRTKYIWIFEWFASLCLVNYIVSYLVLGLINVLYIDIICFLTLKKSHLKLQKKNVKKKFSLKMPGVITVSDFVRETNEDIKSPTTSSFVHRIPQCKDTVTKLEEVR